MYNSLFLRSDLLNPLAVLHRRVPGCCDSRKRLEVGSQVRSRADGMVHSFHHPSQSLRTQRFRILHAPRLRIYLLIFILAAF